MVSYFFSKFWIDTACRFLASVFDPNDGLMASNDEWWMQRWTISSSLIFFLQAIIAVDEVIRAHWQILSRIWETALETPVTQQFLPSNPTWLVFHPSLGQKDTMIDHRSCGFLLYSLLFDNRKLQKRKATISRCFTLHNSLSWRMPPEPSSVQWGFPLLGSSISRGWWLSEDGTRTPYLSVSVNYPI